MPTLKTLFEQKGNLVHQMDEIIKSTHNDAGEVVRALDDEKLQQLSKMQKDLDRIQKTIDANEEHRRALEATQRREGNIITPDQIDEIEYREVFDAYCRYGAANLPTEYRQILQANQIGGKMVQLRGTDAQVTTTDNLGGYLVPEGFMNELYKYMLYFGPMLDAGRLLETDSGNTIPMPTVNDTANVGSMQHPDAADIAVNDMPFGTVSLGAYTFTSGVVLVARQLLQDSGVNLEQELIPLLAARVGRNINAKLTTGLGSGSNEPEGVVTGATNVITASAAAAISKNEILALKHSVDNAYRQSPNAGFMLHDSTVLAIKQLQYGSGDARSLWQAGLAAGEPDTIDGERYWINNNMPEIGAGNKCMLYGDFNAYRIRRVRGGGVLRSEERYFEKMAVGFLSFMRLDGKLIDPTAVKALQNAAS